MTATDTVRPARRSPAERVRFEIKLTRLLMADNALAATIPGLTFVAAACAYHDITGWSLARHLAVGCALFFLYQYVFDTSNQATGADEDQANKPYRPIPSGMTTPAGLMRRFWLGMAAYTLLGWLSGTLIWVSLWQAAVLGQNLLSKPRHYLYVKPLSMLAGTLALLATAWQSTGPIDATGWTWIWVLTLTFNVPLRYEDVRDVEGDRRIGRTTLPLLIGHWPVRLGFAVSMTVLPVLIHTMLFASTGAPAPAVAVATAILAAVCWTCAVRSLLRRTTAADKATYQLYCVTFNLSLACAVVLL
ncbi:UbiA family prenyltransferase [Nonomuraea sp. NN258]|uniref:UbiA family prenyltransferase n=1 Tax=Nonomuraea antri TaxID=2730852 RepID=UPI001568C678|nr:UbiA family prenyltransferase [Nonomuraea antri]NRQ30917.1 UbiA family prenyltransferase [Nonomuraea antri]